MRTFFLIIFIILLPAAISAGEPGDSDVYWSVYGGYGVTHPDLGKTKEEVHVLDCILQFDQLLLEDVGSSWYQGHHSLVLELPLTLVLDPDFDGMIGVNLIGAWTFDSSANVQPYFFGGGGILYNNAEIPGMGSDINGNWQFGAGLRYRLESGNWLKMEYRFHHISNTGAKDPNDPLNSSKFLLGYTF